MRNLSRAAVVLLLCGAILGCRSSGRSSYEPTHMPTSSTLNQQLPQIPPGTAYQAALEVVAESYPVVVSSADAGLIVSDWQIGQSNSTYLTDLVVPAETAARRKVRVEVQPWRQGSLLKVGVALQRDESAQARSMMDQTVFQDQPGNTPIQRGAYTSPSQQTLWRGTGNDKNEERRILAAITGRANLLLQTAASQPAPGAPATQPAALPVEGQAVPPAGTPTGSQ